MTHQGVISDTGCFLCSHLDCSYILSFSFQITIPVARNCLPYHLPRFWSSHWGSYRNTNESSFEKTNIFLFVQSHKAPAKLISPAHHFEPSSQLDALEATFHFPTWHILLLCSSTSTIKCQIPTWISSFATLCCTHTKCSSQHIFCIIFLVGTSKQQTNFITHCHLILKTLLCYDSYRKKSHTNWLIYIETTSS